MLVKTSHRIAACFSTSTSTSLLLLILIHLTFLWILVASLQTLGLLLAGVQVNEVRLFLGRTPLKIKVGGSLVSLGWIPAGSVVSFDPISFRRQSLPVRLALHLSPVVVGLAIAVALLGWPLAWHHFLSGFSQILEGAWWPIAKAGGFLRQWQTLAEASPTSGFGIVAAKSAACALLPFGGNVVTQILADAGASGGREDLEKLAVFSGLMMMGIMALWAFAAVYMTFVG